MCTRQPRLCLDRDYLLYACGLLASVEPEAALALAKAHMQLINEERPHDQTSLG